MRKAAYLARRYHDLDDLDDDEEDNNAFLEDLAARTALNKEKMRSSEAFKIFIKTVLGEEREFAPKAFHKNFRIRHDYDQKLKILVKEKKPIESISVEEESRFSPKSNKNKLENANKQQPIISKLHVSSETETTSEIEMSESNKSSSKKKDKELEALVYDKHYLQRMLQDENLRVIYLRDHFEDQNSHPDYITSRLWMESMLYDKFKYTGDIRKLITKQLYHLDEQCTNVCEMNYWYWLQANMIHQNMGQFDFRKPTVKNSMETMHSMLKKMNQMRLWLKNNMANKVIQKGKAHLATIKRWKNRYKRQFKKYFLADINFLIGLAYIETEEYEKSEHYFKEDFAHGIKCQMRMCKRRADENLGRLEAIRGNYNSAILIWKKCYAFMKHDLEKCWITYQMGRCHLFKGEHLDALRCAQRSIEHAKACKATAWELNANVLIASAASALGIANSSMSFAYLTMTLHAVSRAYICSKCVTDNLAQVSIFNLVMHVYDEVSNIDENALRQNWSPDLYEYAAKESLRRAKQTTWKTASPINSRNRNNSEIQRNANFTFITKNSWLSKTEKSNRNNNSCFISKRKFRRKPKRKTLIVRLD